MGIEFDKAVTQAKSIFWASSGDPEVSKEGLLGYCGAHEASIQTVAQWQIGRVLDITKEIVKESLNEGGGLV